MPWITTVLLTGAMGMAPLASAGPALPGIVAPGPAVVEEKPEEDGRKVWHTRFFRIDSDLALQPADLKRLSQVADTTALVVQAYPLPLFSPPRGTRPRIAIHTSDQAYREAGGVDGSSGHYSPREALVLIHGGYFSRPPTAASSRLAPRHDEDLVVHEIVHLCMHRRNARLPMWLVEGLAEYFACAHRGAGRFDFGNLDAAVREHLLVRLAPGGRGITTVPVAEIAGLDGRGWQDYVLSLPVDRRYQAYATALLLAHSHLQSEGPRRKAVEAALEEPPPADRRRRGPPSFRDLPRILPEEDATVVQAALARHWAKRGMTLTFVPASP